MLIKKYAATKLDVKKDQSRMTSMHKSKMIPNLVNLKLIFKIHRVKQIKKTMETIKAIVYKCT